MNLLEKKFSYISCTGKRILICHPYRFYKDPYRTQILFSDGSGNELIFFQLFANSIESDGHRHYLIEAEDPRHKKNHQMDWQQKNKIIIFDGEEYTPCKFPTEFHILELPKERVTVAMYGTKYRVVYVSKDKYRTFDESVRIFVGQKESENLNYDYELNSVIIINIKHSEGRTQIETLDKELIIPNPKRCFDFPKWGNDDFHTINTNFLNIEENGNEVTFRELAR